MKILFSLLFSLLFFFAGQLFALVEEPDHCLEKKVSHCLIKTQKKPQTLAWRGALVWLSADSLIELGESQIRILQGHVLVQSKKSFRFETSYLTGEMTGETWISQIGERSLVRHLAGDSLRLNFPGTTEVILMPVGFENWFSSLDSRKQVYQGVLRPLDQTSTLAEWVRQFRPPTGLVQGQWQTWTEGWKDAVLQGSQLYQKAIDRHVASIRERKEELHRIDKIRADENLGLRQLYRQKNGLEAFGVPTQGPNSDGN